MGSSILYTYGGQLYVNLTNQCPCRCTFCIRSQQEGLGSADSLWLGHTPDVDAVIREFAGYRLEDFSEIVYCGYGEPLCALDHLLAVSRYIRSVSRLKIRVNTNGLGDLICGKPTVPLLKEAVDAVSISLNAPNAQRYLELTRSRFGIRSFDAMLQWAAECKREIPDTRFSVVDVISRQEIAACQKIADQMGIPLRVRHFEA